MQRVQGRAAEEAADALLRAHEEVCMGGGMLLWWCVWGCGWGWFVQPIGYRLLIPLCVSSVDGPSPHPHQQAAALSRRAAAAEAAAAEAEGKEAAAREEVAVVRASMARRFEDGAVRLAAAEAELRVLRSRGGEVSGVGWWYWCGVWWGWDRWFRWSACPYVDSYS